MGAQGVEEPYVSAGVYASVWYFIFFPLMGSIMLIEDLLKSSLEGSRI